MKRKTLWMQCTVILFIAILLALPLQVMAQHGRRQLTEKAVEGRAGPAAGADRPLS